MIRKRIGNDFTLYLNVFRVNDKTAITEGAIPEGAIVEDLTNAKNIKVRLYNSNYCIYYDPIHVITINEIKLDVPSSMQNLGPYYIYLEYDKLNIELPDGLQHYSVDFSAFEIVSKYSMAEQDTEVHLIGSIRAGADGINGKSNYEFAKYYGFEGTELDYIEWTRKPSVDAAATLHELAGAYNVTLATPLEEGSYYTSETAKAAVPSENRSLGRTITYATMAGVWYTEKYIGTDVSNWTIAENWERVPDKAQLAQLGLDIELKEDKASKQIISDVEYDALVASGEVLPDVLYYTYEA